jgi:Na+/H+ antiporter NhaD/arsenite permease-like protein
MLIAAAVVVLVVVLVAALTPLLLVACERTGLLHGDGVPLVAALPLFEALMLGVVIGVVIGGSATVIGSSSNLVAAGLARQQESRLGFRAGLS